MSVRVAAIMLVNEILRLGLSAQAPVLLEASIDPHKNPGQGPDATTIHLRANQPMVAFMRLMWLMIKLYN
jgi:hypothetical protein